MLQDCNSTKSLRGLDKNRAYTTGYAFSVVRFEKTWTNDKVKSHLREIFNDKLCGVEFDMLVPMGGQLIEARLGPGEKLTGVNINKVFDHKIIYIRPKISLGISEVIPEGSRQPEARVQSPQRRNTSMDTQSQQYTSFNPNSPSSQHTTIDNKHIQIHH